jgi:hypothetical protein
MKDFKKPYIPDFNVPDCSNYTLKNDTIDNCYIYFCESNNIVIYISKFTGSFGEIDCISFENCAFHIRTISNKRIVYFNKCYIEQIFVFEKDSALVSNQEIVDYIFSYYNNLIFA